VRVWSGLVKVNVKSVSVAMIARSGADGVGSLRLMVPVTSSEPPRNPTKCQAGSAKV
jgi:hypothetical protein